MFELAALELKQFHGGITDNYVDCQPHQYQYADNFLVDVNGKLFTRPGSDLWDYTNYQIPAGNQRINSFWNHLGTLLIHSARKLYYINAGTWATLVGPAGSDVYTNGDVNSRVLWAEWNNHTFTCNDEFSQIMRIYRDGSNNLKVQAAGMPKLANSPVCTKTATSTNNYIYSFCYYYEYYVGTVKHIELGPVVDVQVLDTELPNVNAINITSIPVIAVGNNYDTANIKVRIYRTQANGTTSTLVTTLSNGTTTYSDSNSDAAIEDNVSLYTDSGEISHDQIPLAKAIHITDTLGLYGHVKTSDGQILKNRIRQSIPNAPTACPETFYVDVDDNIVAISSVGQTPVVLCENSIYRLDQFFYGDGSGGLVAQEIESTVGCISATSVIQIQRGVVFASQTGFYFTDGWEVRKLSTSFNTRYSKLILTDTQKERIYAAFDPINKRVWWAVQGEEATDVDSCYILDTRFGLGVAGDDLENVKSCFTTASGLDSFCPTAIIFYNGNLMRADKRGYIFEHDSTLTSDPIIDTTTNPSNWETQAIFWYFRSLATSFGSILKRKYVPRITVSADGVTNISMSITSINDIGRSLYALKPIRFRKLWVWGDPTKTWDDPVEIWNYQGMIEEFRRVNSHGLRCSYKQVRLTNAKVVVVSSDDLSNATGNASLDIVTLDNLTYKFPENLKGHFISFEQDNYLREYEILSNTDDTLSVVDSGSNLPEVSSKWLIKGYPKDEVLYLNTVSLLYAILGDPNFFKNETVGANA